MLICGGTIGETLLLRRSEKNHLNGLLLNGDQSGWLWSVLAIVWVLKSVGKL